MKKLLSGLLLAASLSFASTLTYTNYSSWAAAGPVSSDTITFANLEPYHFYDGYRDWPSGLSGAGFYGFSFTSNSALYSFDPISSAFADWNLGSGVFVTTEPAKTLTINVPGTNAYGVGLLLASPTAGFFTLSVNGSIVTTNIASTTSATPAFLGIRSDAPITQIQISHSAATGRVIFDNVVWGGQATEPPPSETPEASSAILIGTSLILLPLARKYAQRRNS